jgi:hypothetical protein
MAIMEIQYHREHRAHKNNRFIDIRIRRYMMRKIFSSLIVIVLLTAGCQTVSNQAKTPTPQVYTKPLLTRWEVEGIPTITQSAFTCVINGFYLFDQDIILFYTLSGTNADILTSQNSIQMLDEYGAASNLTEITAFTNIDGIEIGKMQFMPRRTGIQDLYLAITDRLDPKISQKVLVAELIGSKNDDRFDRIFYGSPENGVELSGYQISILWSGPRGNLAGENSLETPTANNTQTNIEQPTPTIIVLRPLITIPPNVNIQSEITFQIKNTLSGIFQYLDVQLLSDGSSIVSANGEAALATPMILITPTPANRSYPPPTSPYP